MPEGSVAIASREGVQALDVAGSIDAFHEANGPLSEADYIGPC